MAHSGVVDATDPVPYSVVVLRDPDHIQLELMYMGGGRRSPLDADVLCPGSGGVSQRRRAAQAAIR